MTPTEAITPVVSTPPVPAIDLLAEPTFEECITESNRFTDALMSGQIDFSNIPEGYHVLYHDGRVVGHASDSDWPNEQKRIAAELGIHWARIGVHYPWMF